MSSNDDTQTLADATNLRQQDIAGARVTDSGLNIQLTESGLRRQIARQTDLERGDIESVVRGRRGVEPRLTDDAIREQRREQIDKEAAAEDIREQVEEQATQEQSRDIPQEAVDALPGHIRSAVETSTGQTRWAPGRDPKSARKIASTIDAEDIEVGVDEVRLSGDAQTDLARAQAESQLEAQYDVDIDPQEDIKVSGNDTELAPTVEREIVEQQVAEEQNLTPGEDFNIERNAVQSVNLPVFGEVTRPEFDVDLTEQGQETLRERRAQAQEFIVDDVAESDAFGAVVEGAKKGAVYSSALFNPVYAAAAVPGLSDGAADAEREITQEGRSGEIFGAAGSALDTTVDATANAPGVSQTISGVRELGDQTYDASRDAVEWTTENVTEPYSDIPGSSTVATPYLGALNFVPSEQKDKFTEGVGSGVAELTVGAPSHAVQIAGASSDVTKSGIETFEEEGSVTATAETGVQVGTLAAAEGARRAARGIEARPARSTGMILGGLASWPTSAVATSRAIGIAGRYTRYSARDRLRAGRGEKIPTEEYVDDDVLDAVEQGRREFPSADDPDLYEYQDAVAAVTQQARDKTPDELMQSIRQELDNPEEGVPLTKALDVEPDTGRRGRAGGFKTRTGDYETEGADVGPEPSPRFLGIGKARDADISFKPGLPSFGIGRSPTFVETYTTVKRTDADDLKSFNQELKDRRGETDAYVRPENARNPGEIEAVIPGGAKFADVGTGPIRDIARRLGIGSDYYTEIGGRVVPIRRVAPEADLQDTGRASFLKDTRGQAGSGTPMASRVQRSLSRSDPDYSRPVDNPTPIPPYPSGGSSSGSDAGALSSGGTSGVSSDFGSAPSSIGSAGSSGPLDLGSYSAPSSPSSPPPPPSSTGSPGSPGVPSTTTTTTTTTPPSTPPPGVPPTTQTPPPSTRPPDDSDTDSDEYEEFIGEFDETHVNPIAKLGTSDGGAPPWL